MSILFDIETAPLPEAELTQFMPVFEAPANFKDPEKIEAAIAAKRKAWIEDAALSPMTGRVLAIGMLHHKSEKFVCIDDSATEATMIQEFWNAIRGDGSQLHTLIGFNINAFDLPFLIKRSWKLGVQIPLGVRRGRYWGDQIVDLRDVWQMGDRQAPGSLDTIARHLGVGAKTGSGADFSALWASDRAAALAYLRNDLELTKLIAERLGVLE
jgi:hypothetical protein